MNKAELIDELTQKLGTDRRQATAAVENVVDSIVRAVHRGDTVTITGFGVFEQRRRAARVARNPRTGETVKVKPTLVPAFRPGAQFKAVVAGAQRLPAEGPAVKRGVLAAAGAKRAAKKAAVKKTASKAPAKKAATKAPAKKATAKRASAAAAPTRATKAVKSPAKSATKAAASATRSGAAKKTAAKAAPRKVAAKASGKTATKQSASKAPAKKAAARKGRK